MKYDVLLPRIHIHMNRFSSFFRKPLWRDNRLLLALWLAVAVAGSLIKGLRGSYNNYLIFKGTFFHALDGLTLFGSYPAEYADSNHYGPLFSLFIAPFALMTDVVGITALMVLCTLALYFSVRSLPLDDGKKAFVLWFTLNELFTAVAMQQLNILVAAGIILSFSLIEREHDFWAAFFIVLMTLIKLYGIVGLAFFFFSRHKMRLVLSMLFWGVALFVAPMAISSPGYVVSQYAAWIADIGSKNGDNLMSLYQNISLLGIVRKVSGGTYSDLWVIIPGLVLFAGPYFRVSAWRSLSFRLSMLASVLLFVVLFSTGSESSSYIIALTGAALWWTITPTGHTPLNNALIIFAFVLTSLSPTDIFPRAIREGYILPYALKALPCALIWLKLTWEMWRCRYDSGHSPAYLQGFTPVP